MSITYNISSSVCMHTDNNHTKQNKNLTSIELFAGAGGLALGIEKAGFNTLGLVEIDKDASDTLKTNRPEWYVINDDIAKISCLDLCEQFNIKKENWICYRAVRLAKVFPMLGKGLD